MAKAEELRKAVEKALEMPSDELKDFLSPLMDEIKKFGVRKLMKPFPDLVSKLVSGIDKNAEKIAKEAPEAAEKFLDVLFEGFSTLAEKNLELKKKLETMEKIRLNFEATDSPVKGHLLISDGKLSGGVSLLDDCDVKITGPAEVIAGLITGTTDSVNGYMSGKYGIEGSMPFVMEVGTVLESLRKICKW